MAMLVSTKPPELIVRTKVKKAPIRRDEVPFLCDRFWECVLNDYLEDEDSDDGIVAVSPSRKEVPLKEKSERAKTHEKKKRRELVVALPKELPLEIPLEIPVRVPTQIKKQTEKEKEKEPIQQRAPDSSPEQGITMGTELETLLSDDHETDEREKDVVESPRSQDVSEGSLKSKKQTTGPNVGPDDAKRRYRKLQNRVSSAPAEFELASQLGRFSKSKDYGPEEDVDHVNPRKKATGEVIHYAPLYYAQQGRSQTKYGSQGHNPHLQAELRSTRSGRRVAVDPDDKATSSHLKHSRDVHDKVQPPGIIDFTNNKMLTHLPRGPSGARGGQQFHQHTGVPRSAFTASHNNDGSRVQTIDLTNETLHEASIKAAKEARAKHDKVDSNGKLKSYEDTVSWMLLESKNAESDYRRRKLDRKEALHRIRAIKARLQTVDP